MQSVLDGNLEAEILRCDVAIVGGGIAGIACAERLAREAWRQGKQLRIAVIEQREQLAAATSNRLEGWYHTGALYSNLDNPRMFNYFLFSFEDMYNWYLQDKTFPFHARCNLSPITSKSPRPGYDFLTSQTGRWFLDEIAYLIPYETELNQTIHPVRTPKTKWGLSAARSKWRLANAYYKSDWLNREFGCVQAPHLRNYPDSKDDFLSHKDLCNACFEEVLRAAFLGKNQTELGQAFTEVTRRKKELEEVTQRIMANENIRLDVVPSRDAVMDTYRILHDLVCAAAGRGVKFLTDCRLDFDSIQMIKTDAKVQGLKACKPDGKAIHVIANQYVFALGHGFDEANFLRKTLGIHAKIEKTMSVMVVGSPGLSPLHSFARMDQSQEQMVNHICRQGEGGVNTFGYSIIADANGLGEDANPGQCYGLARTLLEKAENAFGETARDRKLGWYSCMKAEGISLEGSRREYSYWLEPRLEYSLVSGAWNAAKDFDQYGLQEQIKQSVMMPDIKLQEFPVPIENSGWALGKAIHFALQRLAFYNTDTSTNEAARRDFEKVRNRAIAVYQAHFEASRAAMPNYICVIPGKFSLFPTLAHQVYLEMEVRGLFKTAREAPATDGQVPDSLPPTLHIAKPLAFRLLSGEPVCE